MKIAAYFVALATICSASTLLLAEEQSREVLAQKYKQKMSQPFVAKTNWQRKLSDAMEQSQKRDRLIIAYFTRSYSG